MQPFETYSREVQRRGSALQLPLHGALQVVVELREVIRGPHHVQEGAGHVRVWGQGEPWVVPQGRPESHARPHGKERRRGGGRQRPQHRAADREGLRRNGGALVTLGWEQTVFECLRS